MLHKYHQTFSHCIMYHTLRWDSNWPTSASKRDSVFS